MLANQKEINRNAGPSIKPIKSLITDIINVQLFVEENVTRKEVIFYFFFILIQDYVKLQFLIIPNKINNLKSYIFIKAWVELEG